MMDFEDRGSADFEQADNSQAGGAPANPAANARAAAAVGGPAVVLTPNAQGVVVLPAGVELDDLHVEGRNLVVVTDNGTRYVIPEGAIIVPQLVVDGVAIPPLNLAALLIGNEPQPAAGAPRSSGGNFASDVGPIQDAYGLGDLLPYTELSRPQPEEREVIPDLPNREPSVLVVTPNQPAGAVAASANVDEAGLPARGSEPAGSNSAANSETTTGTIVFEAADGLAAVTLNGVAITGVGQSFVSPRGTLTITSAGPGAYGYSYTLTDNTAGDNTSEQFVVAVTDTDGDVATATLTINIADDVPTARSDTDAVAAASYAAESGNVLTGAGTTSGTAGADTQGADGASISGVRLSSGAAFTAVNAGGISIQGQYGTLSINSTGAYTYTRAAGTPGGVSDVFTYQLTDGDGDSSTANLTISIGDVTPSIISIPPTGGAGALVDESGLPSRASEPAGSNSPAPSETTSGTITYTQGDGPATVAINGTTITTVGQTVTVAGVGTLTVTSLAPGAIGYSFTLADNTSGDVTNVVFAVTVTDRDGDVASGNLTIKIVDDAPTAVNDTVTQASENAPVTVNVLANDTQGADGVANSAVALVAGSLSGAGSVAYNGNGTFTYTPAPAETGTVTFRYSITDGDGDSSTATVTINLLADSKPTVSVAGDNDVLEAGLPARAGEPAGSQSAGDGEIANGTISATTGNDTLSSLVINGVNVTNGGTVTSAKGVLTIVKTGTGAYTYSYVLSDNTLAATDSDTFAVTVTDNDGSTASTSLVIAIIDDAPIAANDANAVAAGQYGPVGGNVIANDTQGADGAAVTAYTGAKGTGAAGTAVQGNYGTLTIAADGTYSYTRAAGTAGGVSDTFNYTIRDGDGDTATANLVITIADSGTTLTLPVAGAGGTSVIEAALATGSNPSSTAEATTGTISFTAPDGPAILAINGTPITVGANIAGSFGTLHVDSISGSAIGYTYTLTTNTSGDNTFDSFVVRVTDQDGDFSEGTLRVDIVDDVPTARPDTDTVTEDIKLTATGNVITDAEANGDNGADTRGADGAGVVSVTGSGGTGVAGAIINGTYGTLTIAANGTYTYTLNNSHPLVQGLDSNDTLTDSFSYTIQDGDSDQSTSTLTIPVNGSDDGVTIGGLNVRGAEIVVDEDDLSDGSSPSAPALTQTGTFTVNAQDGLATITVGGQTIYTGGAFVAGKTVTTAYGTLSFTAVTPTTTDASGDVTAATVSYSYTLTDNTLLHTGGNDASLTDVYAIVVTDTDGSAANDTLEVTVIDDTPTAFDNSNTVAEGGSVGGNVLSDGTDDVFGADGPGAGGGVLSFTKGATTVAAGSPIATAFGTLTINADGSYTYVSNPNSVVVDTVDSFTYTIRDADGDTSTAKLDIQITNTVGTVSDNDVNVDESGLAAGSQLVPNGEFYTTGQITATGGIGGLHYVLLSPADGTYGTLTLDPNTGAYSYTLDTPFTDAVVENSRNVVNGAEGFLYEVRDSVNNLIGSGTIAVNITDDVPNAVDDTPVSVPEDLVGTTGGNVLTNDIRGADGASLTHVNVGSGMVLLTSGANLGGGVYQFTNTFGTYTFKADGAWTFDPNLNLVNPANASFSYRLTDGDGDFDDATQPITVTDGANPTVAGTVALMVNEAALDTTQGGSDLAAGVVTGTQPGLATETAQSGAGNQLTFTAGSDAIASIKFANPGTTVPSFDAGLDNGVTVTWALSVDGRTLTGSFGGNSVIILQLSGGQSATAGGGTVTPTVTVTLTDHFPHQDNVNASQLVISNIGVTASEADTDSVTGTISVTVQDDQPTTSANLTVQLDDDALGGGNPGSLGGDDDANSLNTTGTLGHNYGADGGTIAYNLTGAPAGFRYIDAGGGSMTIQQDQGGTWVSVVTLTLNTSSGAYTVTQVDNILHADASGENNQVFTVGYTVTDGDKDTAAGTLTINVDDDTPIANPDTNNVTEGATVAGNVLTGAGADSFGADGAIATTPAGGVVGVRAGSNTATPASGSLGGSGVAGTYGTLTLNADGTYSYNSNADVISSNQTDTFVYTIKDADGDLATTTLTITIANVTLTGVNTSVTTYEKALDTSTSGSDVAAGSVTGSQPSDTGETATGNVTVTGATSYAIAGGTVAAGKTTVVGTYGTLVIDNSNGTFTYTQTSPYTTAPAANDGITTKTGAESFSYTATDANGNNTGGTITIAIVDDVPSAVTTQNAVLGSPGGPDATSGTFNLDTAGTVNNLSDNLGADGGTVRFNAAQHYPDLTSNGEAITYTVSLDGLTLTGSTTAGTIFTVTLNPAASPPSYTVNMIGAIDVSANIDFNAGGYNFTGGNLDWTGFVQTPETLGGIPVNNNSPDLLLTPAVGGVPSSTVNTTATIGGIGGGASVGSGETFRIDFVTDLRGDPASSGGGDYGTASHRDHVYDGHYTINGATALFKSSTGSTVKITASKDSDDSDAGTPGVQLENVVGDGTVQTITKIQISYFGVTSALLTPLLDNPATPAVNDAQSVTVNGHVFTYRLLADGSVEIGGVAGDSGSSLNGSNIAVYTASGYNSVAYTYVSGDTFQVGDFGAAVSVPQPLSFALPIELVDGDGDVAASYLDVNVKASTILAGIPTSVVQDMSASPIGVVMTSTAVQPHLIGSAFNDTLIGDSAGNVLIGGRGADTMTGNGGSDTFVIDPSQITAASDDVITDYTAGDTIDLRGLLSSLGSLAPTNATEAAATIRLLGNVLQIDTTGTAAGTNWVPVATLSNNPATISVLYDFDQTAVSVNSTPPLALDLDGDGVEFVSTAAGVNFDYGSGAVSTAWVGADDGILAIDANHSGSVDSAAEIVFASDGLTDLQGLAAQYDSNQDGVLDGKDASFAVFGVWQDANQDGVSGAGEFHTLGELGITSIGLVSDGDSYTAAAGDVLVQGEASFVRDGVSYALADAAFATAPIDRRTAEIVTTTAAAAAIVTPVAVAAAETAPAAADAPQLQVPVSEPQATLAFATANDDSSPKLAGLDLFSDPVQAVAHAEPAAHTQDDPVTAQPLASVEDGPAATGFDSGDDASSHIAASAPAMADSGMQAMDALLTLAAAGPQQDAQVVQPQEHEIVKEALADHANEGLVDTIVNHFAVGDYQADTVVTTGDFAPAMLFDGIDSHALAVAIVDVPVDEAALAVAAAQA
jgi:VCBS repeat-containing protein